MLPQQEHKRHHDDQKVMDNPLKIRTDNKNYNIDGNNAKSISEEGASKFLQNENRYQNPFITQLVGPPSLYDKQSSQQKRKFSKEKHSDDSPTELSFRSLSDSEDHDDDDSDGSHRPPPAFAPSKKYRKIISSSRSQTNNSEANINTSNPMMFASGYDSEDNEEMEEEYESMAPYRTTTLATLIKEYHLEDWIKKHSICEKAPKDTLVIHLFMTNRQVISTLQKLRLRHGLEIEFGSNLFYNVWEFSQRRLFSQLMLGLSPKLYMENVNHLKSYSEAQPGSRLLKEVVENHFTNKSSGTNTSDLERLKIVEDLATNEELKRVAQLVIQSKQKRKLKLLTCCMIEWSEEMDIMSTGEMSGISIGSLKSINFENGHNLDPHSDNLQMLSATMINTDTNSDTESGRHLRFSDEDPSDPEVKQLADLRSNERRYKNALYKINRWKTEGAYLRRIHIGPWEDAEGYTRKASFSPNMFYDGQCRIKCAPLLKKLYYRFFSYVPKFLNIEQVLELLLIENSENCSSLPPQYSKLEKYIFSELDRFKVSYCLKMEICFEDICGIHIQKVPSGSRNWALLVLKLCKKPNFYIRRIMCTDTEQNQIRQRTIDFTQDHVASKYDTHYIIGDERELKRMLAVMIESDKDTGNIERLYRQGLSDISFPTKPAWEAPETTPINSSSTTASTSNDIAYPLKLSLEPGFTLKEDEEEERQNSLHYRIEDGILPFNITVANLDQETRRKYERVQLDLSDIEHTNATYSAEVSDECFIQ
ncbi:hypothetical protein C9374_010142 [Naegleria lovaniensis]|uniref:Uncharacterized protein n=1 Tax=Naegleria lovaniensis TaxID=51637 RepID=A0AA88KEL8_NAELO|nr:uncharacterized protein C9374_010142 [Naegleria lovaniensis]KAG2375138.1 hypothetical protein C9374_010142 [Naegleria lovaniensis]